jgi:hypothetical protein
MVGRVSKDIDYLVRLVVGSIYAAILSFENRATKRDWERSPLVCQARHNEVCFHAQSVTLEFSVFVEGFGKQYSFALFLQGDEAKDLNCGPRRQN